MSRYTLQRITLEQFAQYYSLLEEDFCFLERKKYQDELDAFANNRFTPAYIYVNSKPVGYICYWEFEDFLFVEHFAILKELRNQGFGNAFFEEFLYNISKLVLLEVERPTDVISEKRIRFYERIGFFVNKYEYRQPSYHQDDKLVSMLICSYNRSITVGEYNDFIDQIKNTVY